MIAFESSVTVCGLILILILNSNACSLSIESKSVAGWWRLNKSLICDPRKVVELEKNHHLHRKMRVVYFSGVQTRGGF